VTAPTHRRLSTVAHASTADRSELSELDDVRSVADGYRRGPPRKKERKGPRVIGDRRRRYSIVAVVEFPAWSVNVVTIASAS
jgi:hypothetical protein